MGTFGFDPPTEATRREIQVFPSIPSIPNCLRRDNHDTMFVTGRWLCKARLTKNQSTWSEMTATSEALLNSQLARRPLHPLGLDRGSNGLTPSQTIALNWTEL